MRVDCNVERPAKIVGKTRKAVLRLVRELFLYEASLMHEVVPVYDRFHLDKWLDKFISKAERCLIARVNGKVVGVLLNELTDVTGIRVLCVVEELRGNSIGETLVHLFQRGHPETPLTVECLENNTKAIQFYRRQGFEFPEPAFEVNGANNLKGYSTVKV